jgi:hypothetical protein
LSLPIQVGISTVFCSSSRAFASKGPGLSAADADAGNIAGSASAMQAEANALAALFLFIEIPQYRP